jgi:alkyl hydroperoxide reductase subunit AhpC
MTAKSCRFPLLLDTGGKIARQYGVAKGDFRTTFVVAPAGTVKFRVSDAASSPPTMVSSFSK